MARRSTFPRITGLFLIAGLVLAACGGGGERTVTNKSVPVAQGSSKVERELRGAARAMQKTILQGAATGGGAGALLDAAFDDDGDASGGAGIGVSVGGTAGTYVAFVQRKYTRKARRLRQVKKDLDRNAKEMEETIAIMNAALRAQKRELTDLRARAEDGAATPKQVAKEVAEANGNLQQMQKAIEGATKRQEEFSEARDLTKRRRQKESDIDPDLAKLAGRIAEMKSIANDLASSL